MKFTKSTRQRVLQAAEELGYVPDAAARSLASGQAQSIGFIIHSANHLQTDAFIPNVLYSLADISRNHGFRIIVDAVEDVQKSNVYRELIDAKQIDGLLVLNPRSDDTELPKLIDEGFPLVILGSIEHPQEHSVIYVSAAEKAVEHLIALGHERIAHITYAPLTSLAAYERLKGYQLALKMAGLDLDERLIGIGNYSAESGYEAMKTLLQIAKRPSAVFAGNDTIAIGAIRAISSFGLRVPDDIAIVGYDDIPIASYIDPPLTTVRNSPLEQGKQAANMLIKRIRKEKVSARQIHLQAKLIIRKSCGAQ